MNELIEVTINEKDEQVISGRDLYNFLGITERYSSWFERMLKYGFLENTDFVGCKVFNALARQELQDHLLRIDMAKEISMLQRTEKGKQARQYFIQLEKFWNSPEMVTKRALEYQQKKIEMLQLENDSLKPKALFADAVSASSTSILVRELAKLIKQNDIAIGEKRLFDWLRTNGYLIKKQGTDWNMPTQKSMELGLFEIKESTVTHSDGRTTINKTPKVIGTGQQYFINKFLKQKTA